MHQPKTLRVSGWRLFGLGTMLVGALFFLLSASAARRRRRPGLLL